MNDQKHPQSDLLCPDDRAVLDALLECDFNPDGVAAEHADRARRIAQLCGLLEHLPAADPPEDLADRTLAHIERARQQERFTQQIQSLSASGEPGWRWREVVAVAAMLLIGVSLLLPMLKQSHQAAEQYRCRNNLAAAGTAFGSYANDNRSQLPALRTHAGQAWWHVNQFNDDGTPRSNSAHVFLLIRSGYAKPEALHCPSNSKILRLTADLRDFPDYDHISYSYQNMFTERRPTLHGPTIAVLTDKNPLFQPGTYRRDLPATKLSDNHADLGGQNVLLTNRQVIWNPSPVLSNGDNLWQIRGRTDYEGNETPAEWFDSFLVP